MVFSSSSIGLTFTNGQNVVDTFIPLYEILSGANHQKHLLSSKQRRVYYRKILATVISSQEFGQLLVKAWVNEIHQSWVSSGCTMIPNWWHTSPCAAQPTHLPILKEMTHFIITLLQCLFFSFQKSCTVTYLIIYNKPRGLARDNKA